MPEVDLGAVAADNRQHEAGNFDAEIDNHAEWAMGRLAAFGYDNPEAISALSQAIVMASTEGRAR